MPPQHIHYTPQDQAIRVHALTSEVSMEFRNAEGDHVQWTIERDDTEIRLIQEAWGERECLASVLTS
jgi:hypothetical protein